MAYSVHAVVNTLLERAEQQGVCDMTPMKIQKLVYYAQAWYLKLYQAPLIDEYFSRWHYGPVIPSLYHNLKINGDTVVKNKLGNILIKDGNVQYISPSIEDSDVIAFLDKILEIYGKYTALQLSNMTHQKGTAWKNGGGATGTPISLQDMIKEAEAIENRTIGE
ncbi:hypothetical protein BGI30_02895 [Snodgrassella alvi]|uniref:Panacea domain-containing protein n=1 Tax=Snodgrassella alvi TaxID=1196083 RepID=UPI000C1F484F|nr:type II toxin-antitoxin system antitoxin SocA domain-containing protein [Snodgrassella alvi]PIT12209.1 hypothetical protein BGI30_02895 [Snodgrassella alvi]PIT57178.1 hypothetical protein BHC59_04515 [Snodgrassella alvi]